MDGDYDQLVRTLAFDARSKPKNRTKTEEEFAVDEKERLEKAEAKRLLRMQGESISDDEDETGTRKRRRTDGKRPDADDLDDDFLDDEVFLGPGLTREGIEQIKLPYSLEEDEAESEDEDEDQDGDENESSEGDSSEVDADDQDSGKDGELDEEAEDSGASAMEDLVDDEVLKLDSAIEEPEASVVPKGKRKSGANVNGVQEIPYTFPCPLAIEELEDLLDGLEGSAIPTVVQRIRALHHPSLAQGNKEKLQVGCLVISISLLMGCRTSLA